MDLGSSFKRLPISIFLSQVSADFISKNPKLYKKLEKFQLYCTENIYLLTFLAFGVSSWFDFFTNRQINPDYGIAYSAWAAYPLLMLIGLRYPKKIIPVLILQLFYIFFWIILFSVPLWGSSSLDAVALDNLMTFIFAIVMDILAAPGVLAMIKAWLKSRFECKTSISN